VAELACFSETSRQRAFERFELLRAHIEDGTPLAAIARETKLSYRTLQYWLEHYQTSGFAALARKPRADRGRRRKLSAALQEVIEGLALQKPTSSNQGSMQSGQAYWRNVWEKNLPAMMWSMTLSAACQPILSCLDAWTGMRRQRRGGFP
jgi:putative transposase